MRKNPHLKNSKSKKRENFAKPKIINECLKRGKIKLIYYKIKTVTSVAVFLCFYIKTPSLLKKQ